MQKLIGFALILLFAGMVNSCDLIVSTATGTEAVTIRIPPPHPLYALAFPDRIPSYTIRWYTENGKVESRSNITKQLTIDLKTGRLTPILLSLETDTSGLAQMGIHKDFLPQSGALYPTHAITRDGRIWLDATSLQGISAQFAEALCLSAEDGFETGHIIASHINWKRVDEKITALADPSLVDRERFLTAALLGKITAYDIKMRKEFPVIVHIEEGLIPDNTIFIPAWPEKESFIWKGNALTAIMAPEGMTQFFCQNGYLTAQIEKEKTTACFFSRFSLHD